MRFAEGRAPPCGCCTTAVRDMAQGLWHGTGRHEANLVYRSESGALCESFSDVMASLVKQFTLGHDVRKADWLIGKGMLVAFPKQAFRSLKAPGTAYDNPLTHKDPRPTKMTDFW